LADVQESDEGVGLGLVLQVRIAIAQKGFEVPAAVEDVDDADQVSFDDVGNDRRALKRCVRRPAARSSRSLPARGASPIRWQRLLIRSIKANAILSLPLFSKT
jgi:hypothetical protein